MKKLLFYNLALGVMLSACTTTSSDLCPKEQEIAKKVDALISQMTTEEKIDQMMQDAPVNERLGIPRMTYSESLHGLWLDDATNFPQALALGSTWDPELLTEMNGYVAKEARSIGITHCYSPNLDVIIGDPRYGRVEESYGEDPYLVARMGVGFINGLQGVGDERYDENHIIATAKHFAGYPENRTGINSGFADISERRMREIHFPPFKAAVQEAGIGSLMPGHQDLNGIPCHMSTWLLQDVLRDEWGFDGFLISDNNDVGRLQTMHHLTHTRTEAAILGIIAGVDMELVIGKAKEVSSYLPEHLVDTLESNPKLMAYADRNVKRILTAKYRIGLFDNEPVTNTKIKSTKEAQDFALTVAQKAAILLKNENNTLPLNKKKIRSVAVIGPNGSETMVNGKVAQLGGYSGMPPYYTSIIEGLEAKGIKVNYAQGCDFWSESTDGFAEALAAARRSDVVIMALGGSSITGGEGKDRSSIDLSGVQDELFNAVDKLGKPMITVLLNGRPLAVENVANNSDALIEGWFLGMRTGDAIADILFGDVNPSGKLTVSIPRSIGQIPLTYLVKPDFLGTGAGQYMRSSKAPLYSFGYGLSYTTFDYNNLRLSSKQIAAGDSVKVSVDVTNSGDRDGEEIVQLYIRDNIASVGRYDKMLKAFDKVFIKSGETKTIEFTLEPESFELLDINLNPVIEPGDFTIYVGKSSRAEDLDTVTLNIK